MRKKSIKYPAIKRKVLQVREDSLPGFEVLPRNDEHGGAIARIGKAAAMTSHPVSTSALDNAFRRYGVEAEDAFLALASRYLQVRAVELPKKSFFHWNEGWPPWTWSRTIDNCCRCSIESLRVILS